MRNQEAKEFFSKEATNYYKKHYGNPNDSKKYPNLYLRHQYILELIEKDIKPGKTKVLDIGCGSGAMSRDLLKKGCEVWAVDISKDMLKASRKTIGKNKKVHYSIQDIENLTLKDDFFDIVIAAGVVEYLKEDDLAVKQIKRVTKKGGIVIITMPNRVALPKLGVEIMDTFLPKTIRSKLFTLEQHRRFIPWKIIKDWRKHNFRKLESRFFHFYPLPLPFDRLVPKFSIYWGKKMEFLSKSWLGMWLATGWILKIKKLS